VLHLNKAAAMDSSKVKDATFQVGYMLFVRRDYQGALPYFDQSLQVDSTFLPASSTRVSRSSSSGRSRRPSRPCAGHSW
jgi:hypothetical protein